MDKNLTPLGQYLEMALDNPNKWKIHRPGIDSLYLEHCPSRWVIECTASNYCEVPSFPAFPEYDRKVLGPLVRRRYMELLKNVGTSTNEFSYDSASAETRSENNFKILGELAASDLRNVSLSGGIRDDDNYRGRANGKGKINE